MRADSNQSPNRFTNIDDGMFRFINSGEQEYSEDVKGLRREDVNLAPLFMMLNPMTVRAENKAFAYLFSYPLKRHAITKHIRDVEIFFMMIFMMEV